MIERVRITNFRCLQTVEVPLRPLTVLIGPNDSGKSAFLAALDSLSSNRQLDTIDCWRLREKPSIECWIRSNHYQHGQHIEAIRPSGLYQLPSRGIPMRARGFKESLSFVPQLASDGSNLAAVLDYLLRQDRERFDRVISAVAERVPGLEDIRIPAPSEDTRGVNLVIEKGLVLPADLASTGVQIILFFVTLLTCLSPRG